MTARKIGFVFIEGFADWEVRLPLRRALTAGRTPVVSIGGFQLTSRRGLTPEESRDLNGVAVIGSDRWAAKSAPDVASLLITVAEWSAGSAPACSLWRVPACSKRGRTPATPQLDSRARAGLPRRRALL
jgi:hypothetical protein